MQIACARDEQTPRRRIIQQGCITGNRRCNKRSAPASACRPEGTVVRRGESDEHLGLGTKIGNDGSPRRENRTSGIPHRLQLCRGAGALCRAHRRIITRPDIGAGLNSLRSVRPWSSSVFARGPRPCTRRLRTAQAGGPHRIDRRNTVRVFAAGSAHHGVGLGTSHEPSTSIDLKSAGATISRYSMSFE